MKKLNKTSFWDGLKAVLIKTLKTRFVKLVLKKILGSATAGGVYGFVIAYIAEELYEEVAEPLIKYVFRKGHFIYDVKDGKKVLKKVENAETLEDWRDSVGSV